MFSSLFRRIAPAAAACFIASVTSSPATIVVGSGADSSFLVLEAEDFGDPLEFQLLYTYNPNAPLDGYDLLTEIDLAVPELSFSFVNFGTESEPNYILDSVTLNGVTLTNTPFPLVGPFWGQWVSGGEAGYPSASPVPAGEWSFGSGISAPYRALAPGSWDGFVFNEGDAPPSVAPVPEPSVVFLLGLGGATFLWRRRIRHA